MFEQFRDGRYAFEDFNRKYGLDSIGDEDLMEAADHMKAITEILKKYKEQQCLKNYINSYPDCITG